MFHKSVRRMALSLAGISLGVLTAVVLCLSACTLAEQPKNGGVTVPQNPQLAASHSLNLPVTVSGTQIVLHNLAIYDGPFYEDGSGREVMNVAAAVIENTSDRMICVATVQVRTATMTYQFQAMMIPPYARVLVPEKYASAYDHQPVTACQGWSVDAQDMPAYPITVTPMSIGTLRITNLSGEALTNLELYHKTYLPESDMFIGGTVFKTTVPYIAPRSFVEVRPENYAGGYSQLIYVE